MKPIYRKIWLQLHRYTGLSFGLILMFTALLGAILTVARPIDQALNPQLFKASASIISPNLLQNTQQQLAREFGDGTGFRYRPPRSRNDTLWVQVSGKWNGTVYVEPSNGLVLGRRASDEGVVNIILELHETLFLGDVGKIILAIASLAYVFLLIVGLWLWWPKNWRHAWTIMLGSSRTRLLFDLHRVGGVVLGGVVLISVVSGVYMVYKPIGQAINTITNSHKVKPTKIAIISGNAQPLDQLVRTAQSVYPHGAPAYIQTTVNMQTPIVVRIKLPDDPHPNGRSSVSLHPNTGEVLAQQRWNQTDNATLINAVMYPLHIGQLGGVWHVILVGLSGAALFGIGISGIWLWWRRRRS